MKGDKLMIKDNTKAVAIVGIVAVALTVVAVVVALFKHNADVKGIEEEV